MGLTAELEIDVRRSDGERKPGYQSEAGKIYIFFFLKDCSIRWRLAARTVRTAFREDGELLPGGGRKKKNFSFIKKKQLNLGDSSERTFHRGHQSCIIVPR